MKIYIKRFIKYKLKLMSSKTLSIFLLFLISFSFEKDARPVGITQNGKMTTTGDIKSNGVRITKGSDLITEQASFDSMDINAISSKTTSSQQLSTNLIAANNELDTVYINAQLKIKGEVTYEKKSSFIEMNDIKQFTSVHFIENESINNVNKKINLFLIEGESREKSFDYIINVDSNKSVNHYKITMVFMFNSKNWSKGDKAFIKIGEDLYWMDSHVWEEEDSDDDNMWQSPISMIVPGRFAKEGHIHMKIGVRTTKENRNTRNRNKDSIRFNNIDVLVK